MGKTARKGSGGTTKAVSLNKGEVSCTPCTKETRCRRCHRGAITSLHNAKATKEIDLVMLFKQSALKCYITFHQINACIILLQMWL